MLSRTMRATNTPNWSANGYRGPAPDLSGRPSLRLSTPSQDGDGRRRLSHLHLQGSFVQGALRLHRRAELSRREEKVRRRNAKEKFRYRWIEAVPIRDGKDALLVNWIGFRDYRLRLSQSAP